MRVDGSSRSSQAHSPKDAGDVQKSESAEHNEVRTEESSQATGHDSESHFEEEDSSSYRLSPPPPPPPPEPEPEEELPLPRKDLKRGATGEDVAAVQDSLVELGYLTKEQVATGPGLFGPQTEAALKKFQQEHGVTANGEYAASTREALSKALSQAARSGGRAPGSAMSAEQAFITQFTSEYNPYGPRGSTNCGPASLAMSLAYTGHMPPGLTKEQQVDHARALMSPRRASEFTYAQASDGTRVPMLNRDRELTGGTMVGDGIKGAGLDSRYGQGWETLDKQLAAGNPVIANGYTNSAWRSQFPERMGSGDVGHLNAILGKTAEGKYIVADPLHTGGPVEMTRAQLSVFFSPTGGQPSFNALEGASRGAGAAAAGASAGAAAAGGAAGLPSGRGTNVAELLRNAASGLPLPQPGVATSNTQVRTQVATQATGATPATKAQEDAKALDATLQRSLQEGAAQFERLINDNPDPAYQEALVKAARPALVKMGEYFSSVSPETDRKLRPPPPQKPPDLSDRTVLNELGGQENNIKYQTYYSLARAAEKLREPSAGLMGAAFADKMPPGITQGPLLGAVRNTLAADIGTKLAFEIERSLSRSTVTTPNAPTHFRDAQLLHEALWKPIDAIRTNFVAAAEKAEEHQKKLTELLSGPAKVLTDEQKQAVIAAFMTPERKADMEKFEQLSKQLAQVAPDGVPPSDADPRVQELARALPRMAETDSGAEYLARQLEAKGEGKHVFLDVASKLKDGKDFDEKLAIALVKSAGRDAIKAASIRDVTTAKEIYEGLAQYAPLFGMRPDDMRTYTSVLQTLKPNMSAEQYKRNMEPLDTLLRKQEAGLIGNPDTRGGQALRGLGVAISLAALASDASEWSEGDVAAHLKVVGDYISVGADGAGYLTDILVKGASASKLMGRLSAVGAILGAAGDAIQGFQAVKEGKYFSGAASGAQAIGGAILAASAFVSLAPGLQLAGAALFVGGLIVKFLDPDQLVLREQQIDLLEQSGMDRQLAESLIYSGPEFLEETLGQGSGMSPKDIQHFLGTHPELAGHKGYIRTLAQAAHEFGMTGPNMEEFVERLSRAHNHGSEDMFNLGDQLHTLFFGQMPTMDANGRPVTQGQRFRDWVERSHPEVATWVRDAQRRAGGD
ncbi:peptidoglycan-binding protein [Pyxidicoccus xibeiensis]|uniref:peptidoglycan-binding protein n=1 Tax=Pyxidicoccus xibeiensis TaxID=2906759 RepID=UPI0020A79D3E|nr:peptidoglycan-binding protein [Pyxidicoccus xibeiensis]MCP3139304.1 peptidoglycan-binding protein [Pyxidicoccus xibeiensis]